MTLWAVVTQNQMSILACFSVIRLPGRKCTLLGKADITRRLGHVALVLELDISLLELQTIGANRLSEAAYKTRI